MAGHAPCRSTVATTVEIAVAAVSFEPSPLANGAPPTDPVGPIPPPPSVIAVRGRQTGLAKAAGVDEGTVDAVGGSAP